MAANPGPASAPLPITADPYESRVWPRRNDFDLWRRRLARLLDNDFVGRRTLLDINDTTRLTFDNAAGKQWQAGGNYHGFDQNRIFHSTR